VGGANHLRFPRRIPLVEHGGQCEYNTAITGVAGVDANAHRVDPIVQ